MTQFFIAQFGIFLVGLLLLLPGMAKAQDITLAKTICNGATSSNCRPLNTPPQVGQPVYYLITIDNGIQAANNFTLNENLPSNFVPANPTNYLSCADSNGNAVNASVISQNPLQFDIALPGGLAVTCQLAGYFNIVGDTAVNTISDENQTVSISETTAVASSADLAADLRIEKTASTSGPLILQDSSGASTP